MKNKKLKQQQQQQQIQQPVKKSIAGISPLGKKIILSGIALLIVGYFVLTKTDQAKGVDNIKKALNKINSRALIVESTHNPVGFYDINNPQKILKTDYLNGKKVLLFSGIGDPGSFAHLIKNLGISIVADLRFPDHYNYSAQDLSQIINKYKEEKLDAIVTTEKTPHVCPMRV